MRDDPLLIDRKVARTAAQWRRWRSDRATVHEGANPFAFDDVSRQAIFDEVGELPQSDPLRAPLRAWLALLVEERVNLAAAVAAGSERYETTHEVRAPVEGRYTLAELLTRALTDAPRRAEWLRVVERTAAPSRDASLLLWERRAEVRRRLWRADEGRPAGVDAVERVARTWLERTREAALHVGAVDVASTVGVSLATEANAEWPARMSLRTIVSWLDEQRLFDGLDLQVGPLPHAVAPASFLRGLAGVGTALVDAAAPRDQPWVIAHDPSGLRRSTVGALFAALPCRSAFAGRILGVGRGDRASFGRALAASRLLASRLAAVKVVEGASALAGSGALLDSHEELSAAAFGAPLSPQTAGVLPRLDVGDVQCFAGMLLAEALDRSLVEEHDEDWFRNPRASEQLRAHLALPPSSVVDPAELEDAATFLAATLSAAVA